ncbi:AgmX/PglI C-terminal domain-containing protein [Marinobacter sp. 1_MG-2023]|uniref:AgmX/PglI C-terminal domain-containing protein n=1 Tax=Marinobacter sp. 1_MG-2023 TaxID=3062627 RepID=UPI0026E198D8|nr:AgmX/PglI C-terminal domain-containing protein [Marinobacter sp. 1_MG-2023]MDO6824541.1 AgmX/PglI C-terminal domain-containing protein [Marinobacter sp. 1_MG-2023]
MTAMNTMPVSSDFGALEHFGRTSLSSLSWSREEGERLRLVLITALALLLFVPLAMMIPVLDVPELERTTTETLPPQLARLVVKSEALEEPAPEFVETLALPEPKPAKTEAMEAEPVKPQPEPKPKPKPITQLSKEVQPVPVKQSPKPTAQRVELAREKASRSGLLAMKDRLASMRETAPEKAPAIQANVNSQSDTVRTANAGVQGSADALQGSGGVQDVQAIRLDAEVAGHEVRKVEAARQSEPVVASTPAPDKTPSMGERAMSNIRQVFDSGKTVLYSLYQRELRQDPTLAGKVLLELVIEPDGSVSACTVVSSELENPKLEQKIAMRVRLFNFGADKVEARKVRFPIDFLPG